MFTDKSQAVIDLAKGYAFSGGSAVLDMAAVVAAMVGQPEANVLLAECFKVKPNDLREACPERPEPSTCPGKLPLAEPVRALLGSAKALAEQVPDRIHPGLINVHHLVGAVATSREACEVVRQSPITTDAAAGLLASWQERDAQAPRLDELTERLRRLRTELMAKVFGQDHAIHAFVEDLFNAEVMAAADIQRKRPRALFVFAGPPGVGKTFLAELGASHLERPFKRFDMSAYSGHEQSQDLVGWAKSYRGAHPGHLTEFVEKNPNAVLLFDEIEKAHLNTIHLFLQLLDAGTLEDKFHERDVAFRDTTIIFTTNAGRKLYDQPNSSGVHGKNAAFHRKTILDALENETDPRTGQPFFPAAICSRMATGYPVLFNHLGVNELERVVRAELDRVAALLQLQYYKRVTFDDLVPMCLVLKEGARADARTLCAQAGTFLKNELFKFCQLFKSERLEEAFDAIDGIHLGLDGRPSDFEPAVADLFEQQERPAVLLIADADLTALYRENVTEVDWRFSSTADDALELLAEQEFDMVLLDLWVGGSAAGPAMTMRQFDHVPAAARGLGVGQELLRKIRDRLPNMPVYLLSLGESEGDYEGEGSIDEELFLACVRGGGARGMIVSSFIDGMVPGWQQHRDRLAARMIDTCKRLHREKSAARMGQERKTLSFDTAPRMDPEDRRLSIRLRNLRFARAIAAADAGEVLEDVERPRTRFDDVIGADGAKEELKFFIDYLKNPRRFAALGLKPPKGVLLHGPPGTGKTMLARAMAGESDVAFLSASASSFVTIWQGSGPQNVRDLFGRARRYAPAIIFIDEIDAIGRTRTGGAGGAEATENTLNALLTEMDGFTSPTADRPVFILAATNFEVESEDPSGTGRSSRTLDPALVRRFSRAILVDLPDRSAREKYLALRLIGRSACNVPKEIIKLIAERSSGMSIANLESIIETAARQAAKTGSELTGRLLEEAFETVRFGDARPRVPEAVKRTACHEAGHTILYWLSGRWPAYVTIVARGDHGGYMAPSADDLEQRGSQTRDELLARIRVSLGGRAAELAIYGPAAGLSTGASADLEHATNIARQMVCRYGMDDQFGLLVTPELMKYEGALSSPMYLRVNEITSKILKEQMDLTASLLGDNRRYLEAVTQALVEKERLTADELQQIMPEIRHHTAQT
ncbi:MAG: AAA family ATPase [Pirellulales bacterium]|nr:AAA family ATPase [Pirellulales bacterium]